VHGASRALDNSCDQLLMRTETSNMKPNEPSRPALIIARQRAAHQVLDHGSILYDPFAMKILREEEKDVLQFANKHPLASIGRLLTTARSRIAEDALSRARGHNVRGPAITLRTSRTIFPSKLR
jgi:O-methyltransferase involved in polyketide biosynthesis